MVERDLLALLPHLDKLGLRANPGKCEFFACSEEARSCLPQIRTIIPGIRELEKGTFDLLGSPIF